MHHCCLSRCALSAAFVVDPTIAVAAAALTTAAIRATIMLLLLWWLCRCHIHRVCVHRRSCH